MPSPFEAAVARQAAAISATMGRTFRLLPRAKGADRNAPVAPDAARPEIEFLAVLHTPKAKALIPDAYDARTDQRPGTSGNHPLLRIHADQAALMREAGAVAQSDDLVLDVERDVRWRISGNPRATTNGVRECVVEVVG